jgi:hypothetical protein
MVLARLAPGLLCKPCPARWRQRCIDAQVCRNRLLLAFSVLSASDSTNHRACFLPSNSGPYWVFVVVVWLRLQRRRSSAATTRKVAPAPVTPGSTGGSGAGKPVDGAALLTPGGGDSDKDTAGGDTAAAGAADAGTTASAGAAASATGNGNGAGAAYFAGDAKEPEQKAQVGPFVASPCTLVLVVRLAVLVRLQSVCHSAATSFLSCYLRCAPAQTDVELAVLGAQVAQARSGGFQRLGDSDSPAPS